MKTDRPILETAIKLLFVFTHVACVVLGYYMNERTVERERAGVQTVKQMPMLPTGELR